MSLNFSTTTLSSLEVGQEQFYEVIAASASFSVVFLASIINSLILLAFRRDARLQVLFNYYIYNLAITDLLHCVLVLITISRNWLHIKMDNSEHICLVLEFFTITLTLQEFFLLHLMSRDRYRAVKKGLFYRRKARAHSQSRVSGDPRWTARRDGSGKTLASCSTSGSEQCVNVEVPRTSVAFGTSPETISLRRSNVSVGALQLWMKDRIAVYVAWATSALIGFITADILAALYKGHLEGCDFPERFLYIRNSSYLHALFLLSLFISFLFIVKERRNQKNRPSFVETRGCCGFTEKKRFQEFDNLYLSYDQNRMSMLEPRSPIESRISLVTPSRWFSIQEETVRFKETDLDNYKSFGNKSGNGRHSDRPLRPDDAMSWSSVEPTKSSVTGHRRLHLHKPCLTFPTTVTSPATGKELLLPTRTDECEFGVEESSSRKKDVGKLTSHFGRRYRGISSRLAEENEDGKGCYVTPNSNDDQTDQRRNTLAPMTSESQDKLKASGLEYTEAGLEVCKNDTCTLISEGGVANSECAAINVHLKKSQTKQKLSDGTRKQELRKSVRIFNSIDKYHLNSKVKECSPISEEIVEKSAKTAFSPDAKESREVEKSASSTPVIPAFSFSDDELTEIPVVQGNRARTDSLYTLRSCLSIPEEDDSPDPELIVRKTSSSSIVGAGSDIGPTLPLPGVHENSVESKTGIDVDNRRHERESAKAAFFTIGDGDEDFTEDEKIEERWQGWDNLFACQTVLNEALIKDKVTKQKEKPSSSRWVSKKEAEQYPQTKTPSRKEAQVIAEDKKARISEAARVQRDRNENKNEICENDDNLSHRPSTSQNEASFEGNTARNLASRWGVKKRLSFKAPACDVGKFGRLGKKTANKYKVMLENWTLQSVDKENGSKKSISADGAKPPLQKCLNFYQFHSGPKSKGELSDCPESSFSSATCNTPGNVTGRFETTSRLQELSSGSASSEHHLSNVAPPRFEIEEDADTEDGLLTSKKKEEINAAVEQWLAFYEVCLPRASLSRHGRAQSSEPRMPFSGNTNSQTLPALTPVGDVSRGDLIKARQIWFEFYNIGEHLQVQDTSRVNSPSSIDGFSQDWDQEPERHENSEASSIPSGVRDTGSNSSGFAIHDNSPYSPAKATLPVVFSDALRKIHFEKEVSLKLPVKSTQPNAVNNFSSNLLKKLDMLSKNSRGHEICEDVCTVNGETPNPRLDLKSPKISNAEKTLSETQEISGISEKESESFLRTCSLSEFSMSETTRPSENMSNTYPTLVSGDSEMVLSSSAVDPAFMKINANDVQSAKAQPPRALINQPLTPRPPHSKPEESCSNPTLSSLTLGPESIDIQMCPPCNSACAIDSSYSETLQHSQPTAHASHTTPGQFRQQSWEPSGTGLASRLIESMSLKRRALLAELGLYQELLTGLIPLDWTLPGAAGTADSCDVEAGGLRQGQSSRTPTEDLDNEREPECPYCLRRAREKQAHAGQQVEASFRRLFGMRGVAFKDEEETDFTDELETEEGENQPSHGLPVIDRSDKLYLNQRVKFCLDKDGNIEKEYPPQGGPDDDVNNSNSNFLTNLNHDEVKSQSGTSAAAPTCQKPRKNLKKRAGQGCWSWFKRGSFQAILLRDPLLAMVVSYGLIVFTQLLCWVPMTSVSIYYDVYGFPATQTSLEMITKVLWYSRLFMTPCVYLYYSKGYRENVDQLLRKPLKSIQRHSHGACGT